MSDTLLKIENLDVNADGVNLVEGFSLSIHKPVADAATLYTLMQYDNHTHAL